MTTTESTNGVVKGRAAPLPLFTFPDSGITVGLRRISPDTQARIALFLTKDEAWHRLNPKPEPPVQTVEAIDGEMRMPNLDDPEYQKALGRYMARFATEVGQRLFAFALRQIEVEVDHVAVDRLKADMAAIGAPFDDDADDREIYLKQVCVSSVLDVAALVAYAQGTSAPTKEEIQASLDMFRHQVQE